MKNADIVSTLDRISNCVAIGLLVVGALVLSSVSYADSEFSKTDQAFVQKVSQGGMFEVAASKVAEDKAIAQDVKDLANTEVHDHERVGETLQSILSANKVSLPSDLNADFQGRVDRLKALSGSVFDTAYLKEMVRIHALDAAAFNQEAKAAQNADLKAFAAETAVIVKRHIGALHAVPISDKS